MLFSDVLCLRHGLRSTRSNFLCLLFVLTFFALITPSAHAQSASVSGQVVDPSGALVRDVQITFTNAKTNTVQHAKTNGAGIYNLPFVAPGTYSLHAEVMGFKPYTQTDITVQTAQNLELDFHIEIGSASQSVTVNGSGNNINTTDASVSTVIDRQFVENIPLNGRSFQSLIAIVPGTVQVAATAGPGYSGEFVINGQRSESNYYTLDGVSVNTGINTASDPGYGGGYSGSTPGETALGTTQSLISIDALQEFRATTSTFSAEYGRTPGGQFSLSSRAGTNEFHGSAFDYLRNGALDANSWFNNYYGQARLSEKQNDYGGTLGGPITIPGLFREPERTFFFFSYEGLRLHNPVAAALTSVPTAELRQSVAPALQPFLKAFPLPLSNAPSLADGFSGFAAGYIAPSGLDAFSLRLDHRFGDKLSLFGRIGYVPSDTISRNVNDLAITVKQKSSIGSVTLGAISTFSSRMSNDMRFNFTRNRGTNTQSLDDFDGAVPYNIQTVLPALSGTDWFNLNLNDGDLYPYYSILDIQARQHQVNFVDTFNVAIGRHSLKFGVDYRQTVNSRSVPEFFAYADATAAQLRANDLSNNNGVVRYSISPHPVFNNFSAFVQDEWKATSNLNLSLGLRWDVNPAPHDARGNNPYTIDQATDLATTKLAPRGTPLWKTNYGNLAPRLGAAWKVHSRQGQETVLRIGGGIFYDTGNSASSRGYDGAGAVSYATFTGEFPFSAQTLATVPPSSSDAPYEDTVYAYDPRFKSPYTWQWNAAIEQALGAQQSFTLSYIGSAGRRQLISNTLSPSTFGNTSFVGSYYLILVSSTATSDYSALQTQFQRRLSRGLQALLTYTWSHSIDYGSTNYNSYQPERGSSDFDVRNNFQAAITYAPPFMQMNRFASSMVNHWSIDSRISARSALPVDVILNRGINPATGQFTYIHPDRNFGVPLYSYRSSAPGGRVINADAYSVPTGSDENVLSEEGNAGRNSARAFDAIQTDLAVRREFPLKEGVGLQFRVEAFNILNHAIFGNVYNTLTSNVFGQAYNTQNTALGNLNSLYQQGGPRSLQLALKLHF